MPRYALYFVPPKLEREKLALLRRQLCHEFGSRRSLLYPIHMTLARGVPMRDVAALCSAVSATCANQRPLQLVASKTLVSGPYAAGVKLANTPSLARFQQRLQAIVNTCSRERLSGEFDPHISLVYGTRITGMSRRINPVKRLILDRVCLAKQERDEEPYRVVEEFLLGHDV